ncbi:MAG: hypothetical protein KF797_04970 [Flavobacteriales bacterium]|nr:hypothetical protein [Flavobacteriales bacterium]
MRRIHYIPGLISLARMLPLGLWYLKEQRAFKQERCFNMAFPYPYGQQAWFDTTFHRPDTSFVHQRFFCSGDLDRSKNALTAFRVAAETLALREDTSTWLRVDFAPDVKYATVMHTVESCRLLLRHWWLEDGVLMARYLPPLIERSSAMPSVIIEGCLLCDDVVHAPLPFTSRWQNRLMEFVRPGIRAGKAMWPTIPIFIVLLIISIRRASATARMSG